MNVKVALTEESVIKHFKLWRSWVIGLVERIPEERFDEVPKPFRNNIRWNAGHLAANLDSKLCWVLNDEPRVPKIYQDMFDRGTSPSEWTTSPPSKEEILKVLEQQLDEVEERVNGKLDMELPEEFIGMQTLGEALEFFAAHEALHLNTMNTMRRMLKK
ncbi:DinB family protein [Piscibacillus salipiscarius]|uniref:DinB family protein n=1 Tax=Piscibacillus salipiscarius TaxID=299480 RepID=A0ABW5Q7T0_9BACI|nr:DinB family protein [Piscibacillus salipiscarius]